MLYGPPTSPPLSENYKHTGLPPTAAINLYTHTEQSVASTRPHPISARLTSIILSHLRLHLAGGLIPPAFDYDVTPRQKTYVRQGPRLILAPTTGVGPLYLMNSTNYGLRWFGNWICSRRQAQGLRANYSDAHFKKCWSPFHLKDRNWSVFETLFCFEYKVMDTDQKSSKSKCNVQTDSKSSPVTGLEWARGFQEVRVPRFHDNGTGWW